tara:strand:- start:72 stop:557 length:486 start_codon:yes stop_codon:yes gene_type:complete
MTKEMPEELSSALIGEDELGLAIRSHLYIENLLDELLRTLIPFPDHYDEMNLTYALKVKLACAMGLDPELKSMLLVLGSIRNQFSHNLNKRIDETMVKDLHSKVAAKVREDMPWILAQLRDDGKKVSFQDAHPRDQYFALVSSLWVILNSAIAQAKDEIHA